MQDCVKHQRHHQISKEVPQGGFGGDIVIWVRKLWLIEDLTFLHDRDMPTTLSIKGWKDSCLGNLGIGRNSSWEEPQ